MLRDFVLTARLLDDGVMGKFYSAKSNPNIGIEALTFFAASVFWRAAVHNWQYLKSAPVYRIFLGPYEEQLRRYLLGDQRFPKAAALWVWVSRYENPNRVVTPPVSTRAWNCHLHAFDIPGIRFTLILGRAIPEYVRQVCIRNGQDQPILLTSASDDLLATAVSNLSKTTRLSKALQTRGKWRWFGDSESLLP